MAKDWGLRISKPGVDVLTGTDPEMVFSSKFDNLKIHTRGTGTIYDSTGRTVTIAHNLGYVPAFVVHSQGDSLFVGDFPDLSGKYLIAPIQPIATDVGSPYYYYNRSTRTWADSSNIYIKLEDDFGYKFATTDAEYANYGFEGAAYVPGYFAVGKNSDGSNTYKGALRFNNVAASGSVYKAQIGIHITEAGNQSTPVRTYGIDEDNASDINENPFGRSKTSALVDNTRDSGIGVNNTWAYDITNIFNEIISRGGWSSGNHMAFIMEDRGSSVNNTYFGNYHNSDSSGGLFYDGLTYVKWLVSNTLTTYRYTIFKNKLA